MKLCVKNQVEKKLICYQDNAAIQTKIKRYSEKHMGVLNDWNTCSTFLVFGITILHMNMNGLRVLLRSISIHALRLFKLCTKKPSLIPIYFPENEDGNQTIYTQEQIFNHLRVCLKQPYSYHEVSEHLILKQHGNITRFQYSHILRFVVCDKCGYSPFKNSPIEKLIHLILLLWLEIIRPWNVCIQEDYNNYIQKNLLHSTNYQVYLEHFKLIFINLWGPKNYTRYFMSLTESGPFFLILAYRLLTTTAAICGEHVVEALNNSVCTFFSLTSIRDSTCIFSFEIIQERNILERNVLQ